MEDAIRQERALADLASLALSGEALSPFLEEVASRVAEVLEVEFSEVLECTGDEELLLVAGVGWPEGLIGEAREGTGLDSQAGYTIISPRPIISEDLRRENRFNPAPLVLDNGAITAVSVKVYSGDEVYGVLSALSCYRRRFTEAEVGWLQSVAELLGATLERAKREETARLETEEQVRRAVSAEQNANKVHKRLAFLTESLAVLRSVPDQPSALTETVRMAVPLRVVVRRPDDGGVGDEASAAPAELPSAPVGGVVGDDDSVEDRLVGGGQVYRELALAGAVGEEAVRVLPDPPLSPPHLVRRFLHRPLEPPAPVLGQVPAVRERAVLVGEYDDVVLEHDEQVADLLAVALTTLVPVDVRVAPKRQECAVAQFLEVSLGSRDAVRVSDGAA